MLKKLWNLLGRLSVILGSGACAVTGIAIILQIFSRLFLGSALKWSEEIAEMAVIFAVFCALAEAEKHGKHLQMEVVFSLFPKAKWHLNFIAKILMTIYAGFLVYSSFLMLPAASKIKAPASGLPLIIVYYVMMFGAGLWMVQTIINIVKMLQERAGEK